MRAIVAKDFENIFVIMFNLGALEEQNTTFYTQSIGRVNQVIVRYIGRNLRKLHEQHMLFGLLHELNRLFVVLIRREKYE